MKTIYEVPNRFRIQHIPQISYYWHNITLEDPYVLQYRQDGVESVYTTQLPEKLFLLYTSDPTTLEFNQYVAQRYKMCVGMLEEFAKYVETLK